MSIIDQIIWEQQNEASLYKRLGKELQKIPHGKLSVTETKGYKYFTAYNKDNKLKIGALNSKADKKDIKLVEELTARHCIEIMKKNIETNYRLLEYVKKHFKQYDPNLLIPDFTKAYKEITDGIFRHTGFPEYSKWTGTYGADDFRNDGRIHKTASGAMVRTRVEMTIGDNYTLRGLNYIYEKKLILPDGTILHPDFTVPVPGTNNVIYHEHLGLLDKEEYIQSTLWKLDKYIRAGIYPNRDLLLTVEEPNTGLDMEKLNQMIDCFFF